MGPAMQTAMGPAMGMEIVGTTKAHHPKGMHPVNQIKNPSPTHKVPRNKPKEPTKKGNLLGTQNFLVSVYDTHREQIWGD